MDNGGEIGRCTSSTKQYFNLHFRMWSSAGVSNANLQAPVALPYHLQTSFRPSSVQSIARRIVHSQVDSSVINCAVVVRLRLRIYPYTSCHGVFRSHDPCVTHISSLLSFNFLADTPHVFASVSRQFKINWTGSVSQTQVIRLLGGWTRLNMLKNRFIFGVFSSLCSSFRLDHKGRTVCL